MLNIANDQDFPSRLSLRLLKNRPVIFDSQNIENS